MGMPSELRAGDTWSWTESAPDYPASDGWTLTYSLVPTSGASGKITVTASPSGADYAVSVLATTTASYAPGAYIAIARVSKAGEVHTLENRSASVTVLPDLGAASTYDSRSTAAKALAKIDAWLSGDKSIEVASYTIADRQIQKYPLERLVSLRDTLRAEVASEKAAARMAADLPDQRNLFVRFGSR